MKKQNKYKVFAWTNDWGRPGCEGKFGGIGWYRTINPLEKLGADVERGKYTIGALEAAVGMKERGDIWYFKQMGSLEAIMMVLTAAKFTGARLILDIDDDPFTVDPGHPDYQYHKNHEELMKLQIENADHVVVSSEPLKQVLSQYNSKMTVIPNAIDPDIWKLRKKKRNDGKIRLGWCGSASHLADREVVQDAILEILDKYPNVEFHHAGMSMVYDADKREFSHPGTKGYAEYPKFLNNLDLDIAIAPLKDTRFNQGKSNIKWLEHSMLKTPMVLSDVYPYSTTVEHGKTGYLAKSKNQWVKYLSYLIENEEKRKEIGLNAYNEVKKNWLIEKQLPKYESLFKKILPKDITVYTSIIGGFDKLIEPKIENAEFIAYTDQKSDKWKVIKPYDKFKDDRRNSRIQKIMPHLFIDTKYSIYLDGNIELLVEPQILIDEFLKDKDIAAFKHCGRDDIYQEADAIFSFGKETKENLAEQIKSYSKQGVKVHGGLCECGVLIRRHTPEVNQMNEKWWAEYCRYSCRDQMSFTKAFPIEKIYQIEGSAHNHKYFKFNNHK
jgi:glycosyltransferase involved in cell wall biosynthesis